MRRELVACDADPAQGSDGFTFHVDLTDAVLYGPAPGTHDREDTATTMALCTGQCLVGGDLAPGETQVFAIPARAAIAGGARWTFGLDAPLTIDVKGGYAGQARPLLTDGPTLAPRSVVDDAQPDQPYFSWVTSRATQPVTFQLSGRRHAAT